MTNRVDFRIHTKCRVGQHRGTTMGRNMKENVYDNRVTLLYSRNQHNTVNQLHVNKILKNNTPML